MNAGIVGSKVRTIPGLYDKVYTGTAIKVWRECGYEMVNIQTKNGIHCVELSNCEFVEDGLIHSEADIPSIQDMQDEIDRNLDICRNPMDPRW